MNRGWRLGRDRRGAVMVELALALPVLLILLIGFTEAYLYVRAAVALERVAFDMANLIARRTLICRATSTSDPNSINTYLTTVAPLSAQPLDLAASGEVIASGVVYDSASAGAVVRWQAVSPYTLSGIASGVGNVGGKATLAGGIVPTSGGDTVIVVEAFHSHDWLSGLRQLLPTLPTATTLKRTAYFRGRVASLATLNTAATNPACPD
ncbi:TadE/TadG family type IV pilus assembly protein [Phaeospirillum tilakii]|uniref:TadE/TadG family type IV pilus assembly protein n=1 Tax=Phaeospirillum tilakii TaxID=741673 RepID=A0ABW5CC99_9PROT